jgi:DNA-binding CsgD family transcriptional regulator
MKLQKFLDISQATNPESFEQQLVAFAHQMDFERVLAVAITNISDSESRVVRFGNTPAAYLNASTSFEGLSRDPVNNYLKKSRLPIIYDQDLYVRAHAGDLWEEQAPYGYKTGIGVAFHLPENKIFMLGFDRDQPLPRTEDRLNRMLADLQLVTVYAQEAVFRLVPKLNEKDVKPLLSKRQLVVLQWMAQGKNMWEISRILECSENTVKFHVKNLYQKLHVQNKQSAIVSGIRCGFIRP